MIVDIHIHVAKGFSGCIDDNERLARKAKVDKRTNRVRRFKRVLIGLVPLHIPPVLGIYQLGVLVIVDYLSFC